MFIKIFNLKERKEQYLNLDMIWKIEVEHGENGFKVDSFSG